MSSLSSVTLATHLTRLPSEQQAKSGCLPSAQAFLCFGKLMCKARATPSGHLEFPPTFLLGGPQLWAERGLDIRLDSS